MASYLVTGGCGFVGRHLCRSLLAKGDEVVVLDNLSNSKRDGLVSGCGFLNGDVRNPEDVASALRGVDGVFHLAAVASVELCNQHWRESHLTNQAGSVTVFETAAKLGVPRVVYASSAAVYGDTAVIPTDERTIPAPLTAYGVDKLGTEHHAAVAARVHGLSTVGIRPFNIYGPGQDPHSPYSGVISIFVSRLRAGDSVTIYGDGMQSRDFIHVSDIVELFKAAMTRPIKAGTVINGASGHSTTINELLQLLAALLLREPRIVHAESRTGEIRHSLGSTELMASVLGVKPMVTLKDGLQAMISEARV
ncbi:MAG: epimerase [Rhodobacter sp.]|nr:epimerase [Rhodobacter sp.]